MSVCVLQNLEKNRVLWTDFFASCREVNRFSVSKIGPEPAKPTISLALVIGIINAFDHLEFCLVIHVTMVGNQAVTWSQIIATRYVSFGTTLNTRYYLQKNF